MHSEANEVQDQASESLALTGLEGALALWYALVVWFVNLQKVFQPQLVQGISVSILLSPSLLLLCWVTIQWPWAYWESG